MVTIPLVIAFFVLLTFVIPKSWACITPSGWRRSPGGVRAARAAFAHLGVTAPGLRIHLKNAIPLRRGLGSSGTACLGGVVGAAELVGRPPAVGHALRPALT